MATPRDHRSLQTIAESDEEDQTHRQPPPEDPPPPQQRGETTGNDRASEIPIEEQRVRDVENNIEEHQEQRARDMENQIEEHQVQRARSIEEHQEQRVRDIEHHLEEHQEDRNRDLENQLGEQQHRAMDMENQIESQQQHIVRNFEEVQNEIKNVTRQIQASVDTHQKALEDLVSVNSLFTIATFVGLAIAQPGERSLETRADCEPDNDMGKRLVLSEVIAFSFFLMSSLVAKTLKVHLDIYRERESKSFRLKIIRGVMLLLCGWGSILGCLFLTTSMVEVIQIKVGRLSCGSAYAMKAVGALIGIVLLAMAIYIPFMMHAIYVSMKKSPV